MTVEVYKGKYVSAEDAHQYINTNQIIEACLTLKKMAGQIDNKRQDIQKIENGFNLNQDPSKTNCSEQFQIVANGIDDYANSILKEMNDALDKKQLELNKIARKKDREMKKEKKDK